MNLESLPGRLILPAHGEIGRLALFFPPATGEKGEQEQEAKNLALNGFAAFLYLPPHLREKSGGLADSEGEAALWKKTRLEVAQICSELCHGLSLPRLALAFAGKNLGGSLAAYSLPDEMEALVVTGSIPVASLFWKASAHPVAERARANLPLAKLEEFSARMAEFDLATSLNKIEGNVLVQFGHRDPWIDPGPPSLERENVLVEWLDDDHSMNSAKSQESRFRFLTSVPAPGNN